MKTITLSLSITVWVMLAACSATKITSSWKATGVPPRSYQKILVLAVINEPDRSIRENMEAEMVANLKSLGYHATCACDEFGPKAFEKLTETEALSRLGNSGIDAVLTVVLLNKSKERYYVPAQVRYSPYTFYHERFWGYYTTMYERVYSTGYYVTDTRYFWESNFYSMRDSTQLLYSAQSQTFDPPSTSSLVHSYSKIITRDLQKAAFILRYPGS